MQLLATPPVALRVAAMSLLAGVIVIKNAMKQTTAALISTQPAQTVSHILKTCMYYTQKWGKKKG